MDDPIKLPEDEVIYRMEQEYHLKANINERALVGIRLIKWPYHEEEVFLNCIAAFLQEGSWVDFKMTGWPQMAKRHLTVRYLVDRGLIYYQRQDRDDRVLVSPLAGGVQPDMLPFYHWIRTGRLKDARAAGQVRSEAMRLLPLIYDLQGEKLPTFL